MSSVQSTRLTDVKNQWEGNKQLDLPVKKEDLVDEQGVVHLPPINAVSEYNNAQID